jgi:uncharacterized protein YecE (DUF72 family)
LKVPRQLDALPERHVPVLLVKLDRLGDKRAHGSTRSTSFIGARVEELELPDSSGQRVADYPSAAGRTGTSGALAVRVAEVVADTGRCRLDMAGRAQAGRGSRGGSVRVGCSGWNYGHWRETVYPKGLPARGWLQHYASLFDTVEVNTTFYRLPRRDAVAAWAQQTPADFLFTVKASRYLTHLKRLTDMERGVERFYERIEPLQEASKLGPVLWQLPGNFRRDDERLRPALAALPAGRHCFEFRHASWFCEEVYSLLRRHQVALVIGDHPERPFQTHERTAEWMFIRFHYGRRGRGGNYSSTELEEWKRRIAAWRSSGDVFVYFNNDWNAYAVRNALEVKGESPARLRRAARAT